MDHGGVEAIVEDPELVAKRRAQIVAAATKLFSAQGFYRTTIKDVAKLAGISSGLVYQYFREKDDILLLVLLGVLDAHAGEIPTVLEGISNSLERLIAAVAAYCRVVDRHRVETILAYRSTKSLSVDRREMIMRKETETNELIAAAIRAAMKAGYVRKVRVEALAYHIVLVAHGWALKSWYFKSLMTIDEYIRENLDIIFGGILTPAGDKLYRRRAQAITAGTASRLGGRAGPLPAIAAAADREPLRRRGSAGAPERAGRVIGYPGAAGCRRELALVAVIERDGREVQVAVARYMMAQDARSANVAVVVADEWQGKGVGSRLLRRLIDAARASGIPRLEGEMLSENAAMRAVLVKLGCTLRRSPESPDTVVFELDLT